VEDDSASGCHILKIPSGKPGFR